MEQSTQERIEFLTQQIALVEADEMLTKATKKRTIDKLKSDIREQMRNYTLIILMAVMMSSCTKPDHIVVVSGTEIFGLGVWALIFLVFMLIFLTNQTREFIQWVKSQFKKK